MSRESTIVVAGLVPAAGASRRMGRDKRRIAYRGVTVLEVTLDALRRGGIERRVVVLEPSSPCAALPGLAGVQIVTNPDPARGMLSSIRCGLSALGPQVEMVAILPGDHPFVPPSVITTLLEVAAVKRPEIMRPRYRDRAGHPLLLSRALFGEAAACSDAIGLRQLVRERAEDIVEVEFDLEGVERDLDRPHDLESLG